MGQVLIFEAVELVALPGPDSEAYKKMILRELLQAAKTGAIAAEKVAPWEPPSLILNGGRRKKVLEKIIDPRSLVNLMDVCVWWASRGNEVPKRALAFLSGPDQARLAGTRAPPIEHGEKKAEKLVMIIGALLRELDTEMRSKFKHGGNLNVSALARAVEARISAEHGAARGYGESTVSHTFNEALKLFALTGQSAA